MKRSPFVLASLLFFSTCHLQAAIIVHTTDFIPDGTRTGFNGFESIPNNGLHYTGGSGPYTEGGISVQQVNGDPGNSIWVTAFSPEGNFGWYPDGGDFGYTQVTLASGADFDSVGFFFATGFFAGSTASYTLLNNSVPVLSGTVPSVPHLSNGFLYLGFSGGGFDEIRLSDTTPGSGSQNAFAIDAIEIAASPIPEPATFALFGVVAGLGLGGYALRRRKLAAA